MTVRSADLVRDLQHEVKRLEDDLRAQVGRLPELERRLSDDYAAAEEHGRVGEAWTSWLDAQVTQAAVSWVIGCVFVRFCEDNDLTEHRWIAGTENGLGRAMDAQAAWIQAHPRQNDRDWLREAFAWLRSTRAAASLFPDNEFVWWWDASADAVEALIGFFRCRGADGGLAHRFDSPGWDTRFLGDLYQDLSEEARKRYSLLQTPEFVEEFILDRTLDPALEESGVEGFRMIDPACGSGHFLLGGFKRLLKAWSVHAPAMDERTRVQNALDGIWGVDIYAPGAAIARFRLTVHALRASGARRLDSPDAPAFTLHIGIGDSLIWGAQNSHGIGGHCYLWEDLDKHLHILDHDRNHVVVGNPPYITPKDDALNQAYRERYKTCHRQYHLSVPFTELFFSLAKQERGNGDAPGYVGAIIDNAFMKRDFGSKLIEAFFPTVDLTHVIDTSGAHIPEHGTPTVILFGRRRTPHLQHVRAVLGIRGEPSTPTNPAKGLVWTSIVENVDEPSTHTEYVSILDVSREVMSRYPWSLAGGGANELQEHIQAAGANVLADVIHVIGRTTHTGGDDCFFLPRHAARTFGMQDDVVPLVIGENVRDYGLKSELVSLFPYDSRGVPRENLHGPSRRHFWMLRTALRTRMDYGQTPERRGLRWFDHSMFFAERYRAPLSIGFAFVATHNHFALDRGGKVFKQSAPVIKLPECRGEDEHLRLLGLLNSSTACFWLKQVSHNKGVGGIGGGIGDEDWEPRYEFTGTKLQEFPLPDGARLEPARRLDRFAQDLSSVSPAAVCASALPTRAALAEARVRAEAIRAEMISVQEELDWEVYGLYGVLGEDLTHSGDELPGLALGERAFEIVLAGKVAAGEEETQWFARHRSPPITEIPAHWPAAYRDLVQRRIELIESHPLLHLIERPECKRRWASVPWEEMEADALRDWLLDRLEIEHLWRDDAGPRVLSAAQLADTVRTDGEFRQVLDLHVGRPDYEVAKEMGRLVRDEAVPYLATHRYKPSGMRKRAAWEETWELQRQEDRDGTRLDIAVPPKFTTADFRTTPCWRARGKLDVPKERFISYPGTERTGDATTVLGWAGWDHLQRAQSLARLILDRQTNEGWDGERLREPLAGLLELERWLHQWHANSDPLYGGSPAAFYTAFLDEQLHAAGFTRAQLAPLAALD